MRNVETRNEILDKIWARYTSQYVWNVENFRELWKKRHTKEEDESKEDGTLSIKLMIKTALRELRVLQLQMAVSNINWDVINREHPMKFANRLSKKYFSKDA